MKMQSVNALRGFYKVLKSTAILIVDDQIHAIASNTFIIRDGICVGRIIGNIDYGSIISIDNPSKNIAYKL